MQLIRQYPSWLLCSCVVLALGAGMARAESDLEKVIRQQNQENVVGYTQPIADLFGANMNSGFSHNAYIPRSGFVFRFDIIGMGALVDASQETYMATDPWGNKFQTATVFGKKGGASNTNPAYRGSDGIFNTSIFPFATPQVTIGSIYGTEAIIRYVPIPEDIGGSGLPKITLFGIGARHSISQYLDDFPLDLAGGFMYNSFTVGDIITVKGYAVALQASKKLAILVLYGGVQYEKSNLTLTYKYGNTDVNVEFEGSNVVRGIVGAGLDLYVLKIFADANFGAVTSFSAGIGFGL